jgi:4,5-DOPA dioxygenase extradiol
MLPAIFFGHGNPMNTLAEKYFHVGLAADWNADLKPKSDPLNSAHWFAAGTGITVSTARRTIHDFGGFPRDLYRVQYPAPADPELARRVHRLLSPFRQHWIRHGVGSRDVVRVTARLSRWKFPSFSSASMKQDRLSSIRDGQKTGTLACLGHSDNRKRQASSHISRVCMDAMCLIRTIGRFALSSVRRELMLSGEDRPLIACETLGQEALLSIPTPDHYLPLLYVLGTRQQTDRITFPVEGVDGGSISMLTVQIASAASEIEILA